MNELIAFPDRDTPPTDTSLKKILGDTWPLWKNLDNNIRKTYPGLYAEWKFPGSKYGWNYRIRNKKRVSIYFIPHQKFFKIAFVLGERATQAVLASAVDDRIKADLAAARAYAEGRGITIDIRNKNVIEEIHQLLAIKESF